MINCIVIDDESSSIETLEDYIQKCEFLHLSGSFTNPLNAIRFMENNGYPDMVFLDVDMPELSGLELAQFLPPQTAIIYVTAFAAYAIQAFETNVYDFLLKPVSFAKFLKSVTKVKNILQPNFTPRNEETENFFFINSGVKGKIIKVAYDDIIYVEGSKNYVIVYVVGNKYITYLTMLEIENALPADYFMRVHRSYIINLKKIQYIEGNMVIVSDRITIPLGGIYKEPLMSYIGKKTLTSARKGSGA